MEVLLMKLQHDLKEKWIGQIIEEMMQYYGVTLSKYDEQQYLEVQRLIRIGCNEFINCLRMIALAPVRFRRLPLIGFRLACNSRINPKTVRYVSCVTISQISEKKFAPMKNI